MIRNKVVALLGLIFIWVILMEELSWFTVALGLVFGVGCIWFARKFIPLPSTRDVRFSRLLLYPITLIGEIYVQGLQVIRFIIIGAKADIVKVETTLKSDFLKALLMGSVTLTPGSVPLDLEGQTMTVLNLGRKEGGDAQEMVETLTARLEKRMIKAQVAQVE